MTDTPGRAAPGSPGDPGAREVDALDSLRRLGWDADWERARAAADPDAAWQPVRIAAEHRGAYHALGPGGLAWVELTGRAFHAADDKRALPAVGDWVLVDGWPAALDGAGAAVVRAQLPRRSFLVRRAAGEATAPQPLAANVDTGIVMTSANTDLSIPRLDRYLGLLRDGGIAPVIALSKIDLVADPAPMVAQLGAIAERVIAVSVVTGTGLAELRALGAPATTSVLLGSSGVGKSSLLNAIAGTGQTTRAIRGDDRGRHTTTRRELFVSQDGGLWIDTPGMRELGQWVADEDDDVAFDDIAELARGCRFRDCRHRDEPGCAVRGAIPPDRLASFHKLTDERRTGATRQAQGQKLSEARRTKHKKPPPAED
ncbi:MAG TPA: ribosome small subunit-dependent GTPase A [Kofleriaceae bacterium]|nr:ribosome small subunit-dependent GTPase A [Kofleriaceae bacterium]